MRILPGAPAVSWALSGFVVGVMVTLVATGAISRTSKVAALPPVTPPPRVAEPLIYNVVQRIVDRQLGPSTVQKQTRLIRLRLLPVGSLEALSTPLSGLSKYRSVFINFRLNDNPLGPSWRLRTAKSDVFGLMKALYTSGLPIYDALLIGTFPLPEGKTVKERQALVAYEAYDAALRIPWRRWGRENEALLWSELSYKMINSRFG